MLTPWWYLGVIQRDPLFSASASGNLLKSKSNKNVCGGLCRSMLLLTLALGNLGRGRRPTVSCPRGTFLQLESRGSSRPTSAHSSALRSRPPSDGALKPDVIPAATEAAQKHPSLPEPEFRLTGTEPGASAPLSLTSQTKLLHRKTESAQLSHNRNPPGLRDEQLK